LVEISGLFLAIFAVSDLARTSFLCTFAPDFSERDGFGYAPKPKQ
jgi:hypothetical protein